jgi:predicted DNA-binding protein (MmcQ/YjbR family)
MEEVRELIEDSHRLVVSSLTKKARDGLHIESP